MRTTIYLTLAIAALFISSSDASRLRKRVDTGAVTGLFGATGGPLGTVTGLTDGLVSPGGTGAQKERKRKRGLLGGGSDGVTKGVSNDPTGGKKDSGKNGILGLGVLGILKKRSN